MRALEKSFREQEKSSFFKSVAIPECLLLKHVFLHSRVLLGLLYQGTNLIRHLHPPDLITPQRPHLLIHQVLKKFLKMHLKQFPTCRRGSSLFGRHVERTADA